MNNTLHMAIFGSSSPKVRKTWKHTLSPEKNQARIAQMRFCKQVKKLLGDGYDMVFYYNPGGPAVWGETYIKIKKYSPNIPNPISQQLPADLMSWLPVVEACLSVEFSYIRQWDGKHSGHNHPFGYKRRMFDNEAWFAHTVRDLAARPFVRF